MSYLTPATPVPRPSINELVSMLEAMREAGWLTSAPASPMVEVSSPRAPVTELPGESR